MRKIAFFVMAVVLFGVLVYAAERDFTWFSNQERDERIVEKCGDLGLPLGECGQVLIDGLVDEVIYEEDYEAILNWIENLNDHKEALTPIHSILAQAKANVWVDGRLVVHQCQRSVNEEEWDYLACTGGLTQSDTRCCYDTACNEYMDCPVAWVTV